MKSILRKSIVALLALSIILTSLGTLGFTASAAVNNNLLVNGDFETVGTEDNVIPGYVFTPGTGYTEGTATIDTDSLGVRSGKVLNLNAGSVAGSTHRFRFYQTVNVTPNTDYVWEFYMAATGGAQHAFGVVAGNTVNDWKNTALPVTTTVLSGAITLTANTYNESALANADGSAADPNWTIFGSDSTWKHIKVEFNSGDNSSVSLAYVARSAGRSIKFDDWALYKAPETSELVNGDFNAGTTGYSSSGTTTFEVIAEPDNTSNKVLHVVGGGGYHQVVAVEPNTEYTWTFRMKDLGNTGTTKICVHPANAWTSMITSVSEDSSQAYSALADGVASVATYDKTWQTFTIKFNSGENTTVKLWHNMWADTREVYMDDWKLYKKPDVNELANADFENGLDCWSSTVQLKAEVVTDEIHGGTKALKLGAQGAWNNAFLYQEVTLEKNTDYVWSFWFKCDPNTTANKILAGVRTTDGANLLPSTISSNGGFLDSALISFTDLRAANVSNNWHQGMTTSEWKKYTIAFNSGDFTSVYLTMDMFYDTRAGWTDDWSLTKLGTLQNAGFENETVADGYTVENITTAIETTEVHSGSQSLKLDSAGTWENARLTQTVGVMPNTDYTWTFWYKSYTPGNSSYVGVRTADGTKVLPSFVNSTGTIVKNISFVEERAAAGLVNNWHETLVTESWNKYVVTFNSGENAEVLLTINMHASGRGGYIDDWSIAKWYAMPGDSDNNGTVDSLDLSVVKQYLITGVAAYFKSGMDANENNTVDVVDLIRIKKQLANLNKLEGYSLVWSDDFGTTILDDSKWNLRAHMQGQDDLEIRYDESAVSVDNGSVTLSSGRVDEDTYYTNASLSTADKMVFKYGYVEMRAKVPFGAPAFPSFWMQSAMKEDTSVMGEIDIFEHFCNNGDDYIQSGIHKWYQNEAKDHVLNNTIGSHSFGSEALAEEWHNYGLLWTPEKLDFMVDGVVYHTISLTGNQSYTKYNADGSTTQITSDMDAFHDYFYLIMNNYLNTPNGKGDDGYTANADTQFPIDYEIDYVRLYQKAGEGSIILLNQ